MKEKIYYKVVYRYGTMCSSAGTIGNVSYLINRATVAPTGTKLFVFDSISNAELFANGYLGYKIYKCDANNVKKAVDLKCIGSSMLYWDTINKARKQKKSIIKALVNAGFNVSDKWPNGTLWADSVTILEEVK